MRKRLSKASLFKFFITLHFSIVFIALAGNYLRLDKVERATFYYIYPFFEQHWSMFAPNPPSSNVEILVSYMNQEGDSTRFFNLSDTWIFYNKSTYFGLSQRIIKYFHGTLNNLFKDFPFKTSDLNEEDLEKIIFKNIGFQCIKAYVNIHKEQMDDLNESFKPIKFKILVVETEICPPHTINSEENSRTGILIDLGYFLL